MIGVGDLPALNAALNASCAVCLLLGYRFIKRKRVVAHKRCMLAALSISGAFLVSYLTYHFQHGTTTFPASGWIRSVYLAILFSHTALAASLLVLVPITVLRAWRGDFPRHRRIARWTFPIWLYVSVTGVVVYWMLYRVSW